MVYKRYIKRGGKTFGPYYYHSVRAKNGKIKSVYSGRPSNHSVTLPIILIFLLVFSIIFSFVVLKPSLTGLFVGEYTATVEPAVLDAIEQNGSARVIVILKPEPQADLLQISSDSDPETKTERLQRIKESVERQQNKVLSEINLGSQGNEGDFGIESAEPDFTLSRKFSIANAFAGEMTKAGLEKLGRNPNVDKIEIDKIYFPILSESVPMINATNVWSKQINGINITGFGETVCIIDTGVNSSHADLGAGFGNKVIGQYCYCSDGCCPGVLNESEDASDANGHGTHVAGIVAANGAIKGVAPNANIVAIKVCGPGGCANSDIIKGMEWCIHNATKYNISVISMSLGSVGITYSDYCDSSNTNVRDEINEAVLNGIFVSISAGNEGESSRLTSPACMQNATAIGAVTKTDGISYNRWGKSNFVLAPGVSIYSTYYNGGYATMSGTSMAAPHASGAAALLQQYQKLQSSMSLTPYEIRNLLQKGGKTIYDSGSGFYLKRIDVLSSVNLILKVNSAENSAEKENVAKVVFDTSTDMADASDAFTISNNLVSLDSSKYPKFNKPATLKLFNLSFQKIPVILKDGQLCPSPYCNISDYSAGNITFKVGGFTNYSAGANSNLTAWDNTDPGMPFYSGSTIARKNQQAYFFANYTNRTSGQTVSDGICNISFSDMNGNMYFNSTKMVFEFNRTLNASGIIPFTITCNHTDFETLTASDNIETLVSVNCTYPGSTYNWIINSSTPNVICNDEILILNQSNLVIDNSTLLLNNTNLYLIEGGNNISVGSNATFNIINSNIETQVSGYLMSIRGYGYINSENVSFIKVNLYAYDNSINNLNNSRFFAGASFYGNSVTTIENSFFYNSSTPFYILENSRNYISNSFINSSYIRGNSYSELTNSTINISDIGFSFGAGNPVLNFTSSQSTVVSINQVRYDTIKIYGNVNMPSGIGTWSSTGAGAVVQRYYPVFVSSGGIPSSGKPVNITDFNGNLVWNGTTDVNGYVEANLTLNKTNYGPGNFTIKLNPSQDISFFTDTPISMEGSDLIAPSWSGNKTTISAFYSSLPSYFNITWTDNVNVNTVLIEGNWSGSSVNYTMHSLGGNVYGFNASLPAGTYYWRSHANDTSNNWNSSDSWVFAISKASQTASLSLNPSNPTYNASVNATCNGELFRNDVNVTSEIGLSRILAANSYNYSCRKYENQNYSYDDDNQTLTINKASPVLKLLLNSVESGITITVGNSVNLTAYLLTPSSGYVELFLQNSRINSGTGILYNQIQFSPAGTYNVTAIYYSTQNYSQGAVTRYVTVNTITQPQQQPGGGGAGGAECIENWNCTDWGACIGGRQTRYCTDLNRCWTYINRPSSIQQCDSGGLLNQSLPGQNISQPGQEGVNQPEQLAMPNVYCSIDWLMAGAVAALSILDIFILTRYYRRKLEKRSKKEKKKSKLWILAIIIFISIVAFSAYLIYTCSRNLIPIAVIIFFLVFAILRMNVANRFKND